MAAKDAPGVFSPIALGQLVLPNRLIKSATYECMAGEDGVPTDELIGWHRMIAEGGVGLDIVAYGLVEATGQAFWKQVRVDSDRPLPQLRALTDAAHDCGGRVALQLMHGGRAADRELCGGVTWAPSPVRDPVTMTVPRQLSAGQIEGLVTKFGAAAGRAKAAGFDAVQLHAAHGYLISQFLSPFTNRRDDAWGGDAERRRRFLHEVYRAVRDAVGPDYPVLVKLNVADEIKGGVALDEVAGTVRALAAWGANGIELSGGFSLEAVFYISRGEMPLEVALRGQPLWKRMAFGAMLKLMAGKVAFEREAYFLDRALAVAAGVDTPIALVGGIRSRATMEAVLGSGEIDLVSLARPLIREPDLPRKLQNGTSDASTCINCNVCVAELAHNSPIRCYQPYPAGQDPYAGRQAVVGEP